MNSLKLNKGYFNRFGEVLDLNEKQIKAIYKKLNTWLPKAMETIDCSFLNDIHKTKYKNLVSERASLFLA